MDIAILAEDQLALRDFLADGWLLNGHDPFDDDSTTQWDGHTLIVPAHIHARGHGFELDVQLERVDGAEWVLREQPRLTMPLDRAVIDSAWGVPILTPEAALFFKSAADRRAHDEADFATVAPLLAADARRWLRDAIAATDPAHAWIAALDRPGG